MVYIYILELLENKYYIGKTDKPNFCLEKDFNNNISEWTRKYIPIKVIKFIPNCNKYDEDKYTKIYMSKKGINNVRGGTYSKIKLNDKQIRFLKKNLSSTCFICFICGDKEHFTYNCCNDYDNLSIKLTNPYFSSSDDSSDEHYLQLWNCIYCNKLFNSEDGVKLHERENCKKRKSYI